MWDLLNFLIKIVLWRWNTWLGWPTLSLSLLSLGEELFNFIAGLAEPCEINISNGVFQWKLDMLLIFLKCNTGGSMGSNCSASWTCYRYTRPCKWLYKCDLMDVIIFIVTDLLLPGKIVFDCTWLYTLSYNLGYTWFGVIIWRFVINMVKHAPFPPMVTFPISVSLAIQNCKYLLLTVNEHQVWDFTTTNAFTCYGLLLATS